MPAIDDDLTAKTGLTPVQIAQICRDSWFKNMNQESTDNHQAVMRWAQAVEVVLDVCHNKIGVEWSVLSQRFQTIATGKPLLDEQPPLLSRAWEAATRLAVNIIMATDAKELDEAKRHDWREWILGITATPLPKEPDDGEVSTDDDE